jgi:hypothetical protein|nr:MAG TPA: YopX protein [Caudoviricetes sp.]
MAPKFRAWMKSLKWMCDVTNISFDSKFVDICQQGDTERYTEMSVEFDEVKLMQSTGLVDKNGKEIFEGDVVQFEDCSEASDFLYINTGIIEWCQGGFHVTNRDSVLMEDLLDGDSLDVTIIGNIYENKELLDA